MPDAPRITIDQLKRRIDAGESFTFLDSRNPVAWSESGKKIPGAIRVPLEGFEQHLPHIPKDKPIVTYCT
jgi:rhodanese-related sulfurtransferase